MAGLSEGTGVIRMVVGASFGNRSRGPVSSQPWSAT